jgi:hypothetical protein
MLFIRLCLGCHVRYEVGLTLLPGMGNRRTCQIVAGKSKGNKTLGKPRQRSEGSNLLSGS